MQVDSLKSHGKRAFGSGLEESDSGVTAAPQPESDCSHALSQT